MTSMTDEPWTKTTHIIPASYPRGYLRGVRDPQTSRLKLHVSQYIPHSAPADSSQPGVTLILQHGMAPGDNAACLEPFLSDLLNMVNLPVRSIWAMDAAFCGESFLLNKQEIGDEHHWFDSARDLTQMMNYFQDEIKPPVIGFGQSWGAMTLIVAASWNPLLFHGLVGSETVVEGGYNQWKEWGGRPGQDMQLNMAAGLFRRQRVWKSREEVKEWWTEGKGKKLGQQYDPRVLKKILENDYHATDGGGIELVTPPSQTVVQFVRPDPPTDGIEEDARYDKRTKELQFPQGFWAPWPLETRETMRNVRCKVLYLWATKERMSTEKYHERLVSNTGTGFSGGGGKSAGQIDEKSVVGGHSLPLFLPKKTAEAVTPWMRKMWSDWRLEQEQRMKEPKIDPRRLPEDFEARLLRKPSKL